MRKSLLSLIIVGALAGWAAPGLAAGDTQPQYCTAGSSKDVGLNKNQGACRQYLALRKAREYADRRYGDFEELQLAPYPPQSSRPASPLQSLIDTR
jgi:hypothetical protein